MAVSSTDRSPPASPTSSALHSSTQLRNPDSPPDHRAKIVRKNLFGSPEGKKFTEVVKSVLEAKYSEPQELETKRVLFSDDVASSDPVGDCPAPPSPSSSFLSTRALTSVVVEQFMPRQLFPSSTGGPPSTFRRESALSRSNSISSFSEGKMKVPNSHPFSLKLRFEDDGEDGSIPISPPPFTHKKDPTDLKRRLSDPKQDFPPSKLFASSTKKPPETPRKGATLSRSGSYPTPISPYKVLSQQAERGEIQLGKRIVGVNAFAQGTYMDVYQVLTPSTLVEGVANERLLWKMFNRNHSTKSPVYLNKLMTCSIQNYKDAVRLNIPVAKIYNIDTTFVDHGYLVAEIPNPLDVLNFSQLKQVHSYFLISLKNNVQFDLQPQNLRVQEDGTVVLIDFLEEMDDECDTFEIRFRLGLREMTTAFYKKTSDPDATRAFLVALTEGFDTHGYELTWNETYLETILPH